jgi:hypothetical protein
MSEEKDDKYPKIVFTSLHTSNYNELAEITLVKNKYVYCNKHNYPLLVKIDGWNNIPIGYEKVYLIQHAFDMYPNCEWVFLGECDTVITNMNIKLEDIVKDEQKHFIVTTDVNGINAGNFFIRNTTEGREFLQAMRNSIGKYEHEQAFIIDSYFGLGNFKNIISLYPQKTFNSYDYYLYGYTYPLGLDILGNNGRWEYGDFMIHFPATTLQHRLILANYYLLLVINS